MMRKNILKSGSRYTAGCSRLLSSTSNLDNIVQANYKGRIENAFVTERAPGLGVHMKPLETMDVLDKYIVGQKEAKKAVAIGLRNRWRRQQLPSQYQKAVIPKNILMIGPTGCGKTEIVRRVSLLTNSPFVKVEATKYTEVGFKGKDVDSIISDLLDNSIKITKERMMKQAKKEVEEKINEKLLDYLVGPSTEENARTVFKALLLDGQLENRKISVDIPTPRRGQGQEGEYLLQLVAQHRGDSNKREMTIADARVFFESIEIETLTSDENVIKEAIKAAEETGIVFIDEIDKIVTSQNKFKNSGGPSDDGVQRDLLPIIEGSVVETKKGKVNTEHILFVCSGAFSMSKPSDLIPELQGRLPIRVNLKPLEEEDFYRILKETESNLPRQQVELLKTEGIQVIFTDDAIRCMAKHTKAGNTEIENIGARRLHAVVEQVIEEISYTAPEMAPGSIVLVDENLVNDRMGDKKAKVKPTDYKRYVL